MERKEVFLKIVEILRNEFDDDSIEIVDTTTASDIEEWDSLAHLSIIHTIEDYFNIKLTLPEIVERRNVGEFVGVVMKHLGEK